LRLLAGRYAGGVVRRREEKGTEEKGTFWFFGEK
jgi:hypothetical protein